MLYHCLLSHEICVPSHSFIVTMDSARQDVCLCLSTPLSFFLSGTLFSCNWASWAHSFPAARVIEPRRGGEVTGRPRWKESTTRGQLRVATCLPDAPRTRLAHTGFRTPSSIKRSGCVLPISLPNPKAFVSTSSRSDQSPTPARAPPQTLNPQRSPPSKPPAKPTPLPISRPIPAPRNRRRPNSNPAGSSRRAGGRAVGCAIPARGCV